LDRQFQRSLANDHHLLPALGSRVVTADWCDAVLEAIATHVVGNRPDRFEPR